MLGQRRKAACSSTAFSYPVLEELRKKTEVFADLIAFKPIPLTVTVDGNPELIDGEMVSGNAFSGLGVEPLLGRPLMPADDAAPGKGPVAVISEGYWAERFGRSKLGAGQNHLRQWSPHHCRRSKPSEIYRPADGTGDTDFRALDHAAAARAS